jgi:hypothetical protein
MKKRIVKKSVLAKLETPKDMKPRRLKKFKTRDRKFLVLVLRAGVDAWEVVRIARGVPPLVMRRFDTTGESEITSDLRSHVAREMAIWFARHLALNNMVLPSARKERGRRREIFKKAVPKHQHHQATKAVVAALRNPRTKAPEKVVGKLDSAYVFIYDPKSRPSKASQPTTFVLHTATCKNLDGRRRSVRKRGASWLVEARTPEEAIREQIREFDEEDKGYDRSDFTVHACHLA